MASMPSREHYNSGILLDRAVENMFHLVECRNIMLWIMESIEAMEAASYCGDAISMLVIDKSDNNVARLFPIRCSKIKQLASAFEICLFQLVSIHRPAALTALVHNDMSFANEVTVACREALSELGLEVLVAHCTELWRCTAHVLDMAVLSYAGAHTQPFGKDLVKLLTLPGPFLEKQYFAFRRRSFLCLNDFLGGEEAWVLEWNHPEAPQIDLPPLYLSTHASTFGDIWGPMWKSCALRDGQADQSHILRYSVGNGIILPWKHPSSSTPWSMSNRKEGVFCHWISDKDASEIDNLADASRAPLHPDDILLIGASTRLQHNLQCNLSRHESKQRLRNSGTLSELGTVKNARMLESEAVSFIVGPPYAKVGVQRTYKKRWQTWKDAWIENWKNSPEGRNVRILEYWFGVGVSACTYNARRRRLITLLGSKTMLNYLRNGSLIWKSSECEAKFYAALESSNHRAFRTLYKSQKDWQPDLGKAITYCLDALAETGMSGKGLDTLWVPGSEPGQRVNVPLCEYSWVGFLKDTKDCCTMAVLEDNCLELLTLKDMPARRCQNSAIPSPTSTADQVGSATVLETAFLLNESSVPETMSSIHCRGPNGSSSPHSHRWRTSALEYGEKFHFGENGQLKFIKSLGSGQILANWKSSWALQHKMPGQSRERRHREYIRDEKGGAAPVCVILISSDPEKVTSSLTALGKLPDSNHSGVTDLKYIWASGKRSRPRTAVLTVNNTTRQIMASWMKGEQASRDSLKWDGVKQAIAGIVAGLPSPMESRSEMQRKENELQRQEYELQWPEEELQQKEKKMEQKEKEMEKKENEIRPQENDAAARK